MSFIDLSSLGFQSTQTELLQTWLNNMQTSFPGYVPGEASGEYIDAQSIAALIADASQTGVIVPSAIIRAFGTKLFGIPYLQGTAAIAPIQITAVDTTGYTLDAGTDLIIGDYNFVTQADMTIANGDTTGTVNAVSLTIGTSPNGSSSPASLSTAIGAVNWVSDVTALAPASGGIDPETDDDYQNRLIRQLALQAPRPITASDFATMALSFNPASGTDQQEVGRATALDGYLKADASFTVTAVGSNAALTVTAAPAAGITAAQGATISGTDIQASSLVESSSSGTITMSLPASGSGTGITATVGGTVGNERTVTIAVTDTAGGALNSDTKTAVQAWLEAFRELNFVVDVIDPTYTPVYVTSSVHLYPGFDPTATAAAIQQAIMSFLSPATFGLPTFGNSQAWLQGTTIFYSKLMAVIQDAAQGAVEYVVDGSLKFGTGATPTNTSDLVLAGPLALPTSTTSTVSLPTIV